MFKSPGVAFIYLLTSARADVFFLCVLNGSALLCTTAEGWLQRVVVLGAETHVIEEIQLFETPQPVDSLTISHSKVRRSPPRSPGITC